MCLSLCGVGLGLVNVSLLVVILVAVLILISFLFGKRAHVLSLGQAFSFLFVSTLAPDFSLSSFPPLLFSPFPPFSFFPFLYLPPSLSPSPNTVTA